MVAKLTVVYEDDYVLVVNKPAGLVVHGDGRTEEETLVDWLLQHYPDIAGVGEPWLRGDGTDISRPGIVHRLDRETSGVLVVAKTQESFKNLKKQFQERTVRKIYRAFVYGRFKDETGSIDRPIGKSRRDFRLWSAQRGARGELRQAITEYEVLTPGNDATYVEVYPKTGRTHQIRAHLKAIHHPVVCDKLYAPKHACLYGFTRLALHALSITFLLESGTSITAAAPLPKDFTDALEFL